MHQPIIILFAVDVAVPGEARQLGGERHTAVAATKTAAVPRAVRSPQVPSLGYLPSATPATEDPVGVVVLAASELPVADGTIPWRGCAAPAPDFLQHLETDRRGHRPILPHANLLRSLPKFRRGMCVTKYKL